MAKIEFCKKNAPGCALVTVGTHIYTRIHIYIHTSHLTYLNSYTHAHMHTCTHSHIHTFTHAHMHTCTHPYTRVRLTCEHARQARGYGRSGLGRRRRCRGTPTCLPLPPLRIVPRTCSFCSCTWRVHVCMHRQRHGKKGKAPPGTKAPPSRAFHPAASLDQPHEHIVMIGITP